MEIEWKTLVAMVPGCEIGKLEHLTGATKKSPEDDPTFQNWDLEDSANEV